ncbi:hypothetical protein C2W62_08375, partial [Candidatus Entotheonella serta]
MVAWIAQLALAHGQDLLNDTIRFSVFNLQMRPYAVMPDARRDIMSMAIRPGDERLYVVTRTGMIYAINEDAGGRTT